MNREGEAEKDTTHNNTIPEIPFIYKNKVPRCNPSLYTKSGNSKICIDRFTTTSISSL
jgi:hypothetical protein